MSVSPEKLTKRPGCEDDQARDVLSDLLGSLRLTTLIYGRLELRAPWGLRFPDRPDTASLYVVARGGAQLEPRKGRPIALAAGDVALVPAGGTHVLRDGNNSPLRELGENDCIHSTLGEPKRFGGQGAQTTLVAGAFRVGPFRRPPLLDGLPEVVHIAASDQQASPLLSATVQILIAESAARSPGGTVVMSRLVDVLLVHALRSTIASKSCQEHGLSALADPQITRSLQLMHAHPGQSWTVQSLARAVGLSRSGFAARFSGLVGEAPLEYLSRWRMTRAAELLRESDLPIPQIAEQAGYASEAAFNRAFKRHEGTAPARYRRQHTSGTGTGTHTGTGTETETGRGLEPDETR
jgi:AraC-like DNA-binding protein